MTKKLSWSSAYWIDWRWKLFGIKFHFTWRDASGIMGRFGGGWNWKVGVQWGKSDALFSLFVCELSVSWYKKK